MSKQWKYLGIFFFSLFLVVSLPTGLGAEEKTDKKGFGISIAPSILELSGSAGQSQQGTVRVSNNAAHPIQILAEVSDVGNKADAKGRLTRQFLPPGTLPFSCAKWILLREKEWMLKPKEFKDVTFILSPPADSLGGSACVIFFKGIPVLETEVSRGGNQPQTMVQIQPRLGAMVFHEIEGTVKRTGVLGNLTHEAPTAKTPLKIRYVFKNAGNADILISGTFYILDKNKVLAAKGNLKPIRTFPGDEGYEETEWAGPLSPGDYQLVVNLELGPKAQEVIVRELALSVK